MHILPIRFPLRLHWVSHSLTQTHGALPRREQLGRPYFSKPTVLISYHCGKLSEVIDFQGISFVSQFMGLQFMVTCPMALESMGRHDRAHGRKHIHLKAKHERDRKRWPLPTSRHTLSDLKKTSTP